MTWNLFIDDERNLEDVTWAPWQIREKYRNEEWVVCRHRRDVVFAIMSRGMPSFVSFDHDLGEEEGNNGHAIARSLVDWDMSDEKYSLPPDFDFYVHSQNPIGKANIEGLLNGYLKAKARAAEVPCNEERFDELYRSMMEDDEGDITVGKLKG